MSLSSVHSTSTNYPVFTRQKRPNRPASVSTQPIKSRPNRPTTLDFNKPQTQQNNQKFQRDIVTTPGLHYSMKNRLQIQNKPLNSDTESVKSVVSAMAGAVTSAGTAVMNRFIVRTPINDAE